MSVGTKYYTPPTHSGRMALNSGHIFDIFNPEPDDFRIDDIGHALGNICRYGGHCRNFYSVAQHSVYASFMAPRGKRKAALLHDGTEAYLVDLIRPVKRIVPQYIELEAVLAGKLATAFGLPVDAFDDPQIHEVDDLLLSYEVAALTTNPELFYSGGVARPDRTIFSVDPHFKLWSPQGAKHRFLLRYKELTEQEMDQAA
jgi:hypothetical protein